MATCFCISGTFSDLDCDDVYAFADGLRVIATLGTAERCAPLMDGDSLDIIDPAQYSKISLQPGPSWRIGPLPANNSATQANRIAPQGSWYDIEIVNIATSTVVLGPVRVRLDADATYTLDANNCVPISELITAGVTL